MMSKRKKIWLDNIFGTVFIFALMGTIALVSQFRIFDAFDPIGKALADMEMTDIVFSQLREDPEIDTNVVIVNIGYLNRSGIAQQLNVINQFDPAVVGFDFDFLHRNEEDPEGDSILADAIANTKNLVMISKLLQSDSLMEVSPGEKFDSMSFSDPFLSQGVHFAFANLETDAEFQDDFKACRAFPPKRKVKGEMYNAFAVEMAKQYDPEKVEKFLKRNKDWEVINYRGNVVDFFGRTEYPTSYFALDWDQGLDPESFAPEMIKDKIVIFGFLGENFFDTSWDDKFFTPLNKNIAGKANPDMYGVVIHANIVSMILKEDYVNTLSSNTALIIGFLVCFLNVIFFSWIYRRLPKWYDGLTKLIQIVELIILVSFMIYAFHFFSFKLNLTITMAAIALAGDGLEVYYGVIKNLFDKKTRRQLFTIQRDLV